MSDIYEAGQMGLAQLAGLRERGITVGSVLSWWIDKLTHNQVKCRGSIIWASILFQTHHLLPASLVKFHQFTEISNVFSRLLTKCCSEVRNETPSLFYIRPQHLKISCWAPGEYLQEATRLILEAPFYNLPSYRRIPSRFHIHIGLWFSVNSLSHNWLSSPRQSNTM